MEFFSWSHLLVATGFGALVATVIYGIIDRYWLDPGAARRETELQARVLDLEGQVDFLENQIDVLTDRVNFLLDELRSRNGGSAPESYSGAAAWATSKPEQVKQPLLLVIIGDDPELELDLSVFRRIRERTGLRFIRLLRATSERVERVIERHRMERRPIQYVHMSVHSAEGRIQLSDTAVDGVWMSSVMRGVEVLMIAGCNTDIVGDLVGVVPHVITLMEQITHSDARLFSEAFWEEIGNGKPPIDAFYAALDRCPSNVAEFAEIHI